MSGHSKWNNIKRKKEKTDGQKAKIFTKIGREIAVAVKESGPDPASNSKLRDAISKAKSNNVPNDNIERIIKKAGEDKKDYEEIVYEGYGPNGVAVMVETLTDNRNRTAGDIRHYFDKFGGNLGQNGCVSFMFSQKGVLILNGEGLDEEKALDDCFEAGADDFSFEDGTVEVMMDVSAFHAVQDNLLSKGYQILSAELEYIPSTYTAIDDVDMRTKMERLIESLEDNEDVQDIWHNWENEQQEEDED